MRATLNARLMFLRLQHQTTNPSTMLQKLEQAEQNLHDLGFHRHLAKIHTVSRNILQQLGTYIFLEKMSIKILG